MFAVLDTKWGEPTLGEPSGTISWSSDLGGDLVLAPGVTDQDIDDALQAAFDRWEDVAAIDFERVQSGGDVTMRASDLNSDRMDGDPFVAGLATWAPDVTGTLNEVTFGRVEFADELLWSDDGVGGTNFFAVALHEIGHIIGLDHPGDASEIMNATIFVDDLGDGDIQGAQYLYGTDAGDIPVESGEPADATNPVSGDGGGESAGSSGGAILGLLLGLVALLTGIFTGGASAAVALAAGRVAEGDDADGDDADVVADMAGHSHDHDHLIYNADGTVSHEVYIADTFLADMPTVNVGQIVNPCGCVGLCEHMVNDGDAEAEDLFV